MNNKLLKVFNLHTHKTSVYEKDGYSLDATITEYNFDSLGNVYFKKQGLEF